MQFVDRSRAPLPSFALERVMQTVDKRLLWAALAGITAACVPTASRAAVVPTDGSAYYGDTFTIGAGAPEASRQTDGSGTHYITLDSPEINNTGTATTYFESGAVLNDGNFSNYKYPTGGSTTTNSAFQFDTSSNSTGTTGSNGVTNTGDLLFSNPNSTDVAEEALLIKPTPLLTANTFNTPFKISTDIFYYRVNAAVTSRAGLAFWASGTGGGNSGSGYNTLKNVSVTIGPVASGTSTTAANSDFQLLVTQGSGTAATTLGTAIDLNTAYGLASSTNFTSVYNTLSVIVTPGGTSDSASTISVYFDPSGTAGTSTPGGTAGSLVYGTDNLIETFSALDLSSANSFGVVGNPTYRNDGQGANKIAFDNFFVQSVPEPTTFAALVFGGAALLTRRRRVALTN